MPIPRLLFPKHTGLLMLPWTAPHLSYLWVRDLINHLFCLMVTELLNHLAMISYVLYLALE